MSICSSRRPPATPSTRYPNNKSTKNSPKFRRFSLPFIWLSLLLYCPWIRNILEKRECVMRETGHADRKLSVPHLNLPVAGQFVGHLWPAETRLSPAKPNQPQYFYLKNLDASGCNGDQFTILTTEW